MDAQDCPIRHFERIAHLARELKALPAQVLEHGYSYLGFGSWWLVLRVDGLPVRLAYDGRDGILSVERSVSKRPPFEWTAGTSYTLNDPEKFPDPSEAAEMILRLVRAR